MQKYVSLAVSWMQVFIFILTTHIWTAVHDAACSVCKTTYVETSFNKNLPLLITEFAAIGGYSNILNLSGTFHVNSDTART